VIGHQAEGDELDTTTAYALNEQRDKRFVVSRFTEDDGTAIPAVHDVLNDAGGCDTLRSWHRI
jgi:hypothetical protein